MPITPQLFLLIVDDEPQMLELLQDSLAAKPWRILTATNGHEALACFAEHHIQVALLDLNLPNLSGLEILMHLRAEEEPVEVVFLTGHHSVQTAVEAMRLGAFHYLTKPADLKELAVVLTAAFERQRLHYENTLLRLALRQGNSARGRSVVAVSPVMQTVLQEVRQIAPTDLPVLLTGETGVGKDVIATQIHLQSQRCEEPCIVVNCAAMPESLVDAELFGHAKGAFTGADETRPGLIETAHGGTLLLDEIGDLPTGAQARLLRVLENGLIRRVGENREIAVNVRIIAATNRPLGAMRTAGSFREDLYHRLAGFTLDIPPLRDRREDIMPLARTFLAHLIPRGADRMTLADEAEPLLQGQSWPGNARQLRNVVECGWVLALREGADVVAARHLRPALDREATTMVARPTAPAGCVDLLSLKDQEEQYIRQVLARCDGSRRQTARVLGISERSLYRRL